MILLFDGRKLNVAVVHTSLLVLEKFGAHLQKHIGNWRMQNPEVQEMNMNPNHTTTVDLISLTMSNLQANSKQF